MKRLIIIALAVMLFLTACAANRHKLSPQGNVNLKTANVYYNQQNVEEAFKYYTLVIQDNPEHALALRRVADINLYNAERIADQAISLNKAAYEGYDKAIGIVEKYTEPTEDEQADLRDMKRRRTSAWTRIFQAGENQLAAGNTADAIKTFEIVSQLDPNRTEPLYKLANIYQQEQKDEAKAEEILLRIYNVDPENPQVQQQMGIFYLNKKDYAAALPFFDKAYTANPTEINNILNLVSCLFELERYPEAKEKNMLALNLQPRNPEALATGYDIATKLSETEAALGYLKTLLDIQEDDSYYENIVATLNSLERWDDLITYSQKWHNYDETNKLPVQFVILGAQKVKNKALETEYINILKNMQ
jgi:tetratricopeptide (TPR) repeat protein